MLPFEFIVAGPPISHQTRNRERLAQWKAIVRRAAAARWNVADPPLEESLILTVVYYHDGIRVNIDNDNLVKPIQDALQGLIYINDALITDTIIRKRDLNGSFRVRGMSRVLAEGFIKGNEFLYVRVDRAQDHGELP